MIDSLQNYIIFTITCFERCRRMNLAFILVTLIANLTVASEVHILLSLHKS